MRLSLKPALIVLTLTLPQISVTAAPGVEFIRGDADGNGAVEITDAIMALSFLFRGGEAPICSKAADTNDDGNLDVSDSINALAFLFLGGSPPPAPYPRCGVDPTADDLACESSEACPAEFICPNPTVRSLRFAIVSRSSRFSGLVRITGNVRNLGGDYVSNPGQQALVLYETPLGGRPRVVARRAFTNMNSGANLSIAYERDWNSSSPAEGEFPPTYLVQIEYDPDIAIDGNRRNDDCDLGSNRLERSGTGINDLF